MSGGLDSSVIAYGLKNKLGNLNSFTTIVEPNIIDKEDFNSDASVAKRFAEEINLNHKEIKITPEIFVKNGMIQSNLLKNQGIIGVYQCTYILTKFCLKITQ